MENSRNKKEMINFKLCAVLSSMMNFLPSCSVLPGPSHPFVQLIHPVNAPRHLAT